MSKIEFCPDCGRMLHVEFMYGRRLGSCRCGFFKEVEEPSFSEKTNSLEKGNGVIESNNEEAGFPHVCDKCGHGESEVFDLGASYSDESNIYLFKCKKCGYVSREAEGSGNK